MNILKMNVVTHKDCTSSSSESSCGMGIGVWAKKKIRSLAKILLKYFHLQDNPYFQHPHLTALEAINPQHSCE